MPMTFSILTVLFVFVAQPFLAFSGDSAELVLSSFEEVERAALIEFFHATNGPKWLQKRGWDEDSVHHCSWCVNWHVQHV